MKIPILGLEISRIKALPPLMSPPSGSSGGWWPIIREPFTGAWQRNMEVRADTVLTYSIVFSCVTLIASDISKLWLDLVEKGEHGVWSVVEDESPFWRVLRKPNRYQNRIKFIEWWIFSKLIHGNTYALKSRDGRGMVDALYLLDPQRVKPLIAPDGAVFYQLDQDQLSRVGDQSTIVPASEIIHDIMCPLYHPLVGVSPIFACGVAAMQGLAIQNNSTKFFENGSQPSGVLTAPGTISSEAAKRMQDHWESEFGGANNIGKVAVLGDGLKYEPMSRNAVDSQLIEQLKWTGETVCAVFHVPPYKVGIGPAPPYTDVQSINLEYYSNALQNPIECLELCLDEGLEMPARLGTRFDIDSLARMDTATAYKAESEAVNGGWGTPNEARLRFDRVPLPGGDTAYMQQQQWPLHLLAGRRDQLTAPEPLPPVDDATDDADMAAAFEALLRKELAA